MNTWSEDAKDFVDCIVGGENFLRAGQVTWQVTSITYVSSDWFGSFVPLISPWIFIEIFFRSTSLSWFAAHLYSHYSIEWFDPCVEDVINRVPSEKPVGVESLNSSGPVKMKWAECCRRNFMRERIWSGLSGTYTTSSSTFSFPLELVNMIEPCLWASSCFPPNPLTVFICGNST